MRSLGDRETLDDIMVRNGEFDKVLEEAYGVAVGLEDDVKLPTVEELEGARARMKVEESREAAVACVSLVYDVVYKVSHGYGLCICVASLP